ncbi:hypothetical protein MPSI1_000873 [Malassezia psittaci]|uniref:NAD(P)-binding protein n=1 Tax=Malassezia psittaci TaxID=1821823 RepID=A0AAF0FCH2_9BASI|nr:hypothetical protein MPSI1_000873 [Malassezia psittaci]
MPDQHGRVAIVTGGNAGVGFETVRCLLQKSAKVYLAARSEQRAKDAIKKLEAENLPGEVIFAQLDLADLKNIRAFANNFMQKEKRLDMLFNNAGVMLPEAGPKTADGYELQLGTNALGHHYLTRLLIPALAAAEKSTPERPPRVCFTSSMAQRFGSPSGFNPEDPTGEKDKPYFMPLVNRQYGTSKLCNVLSANKFQREFGSKGIVFTSANPGNLRTELMRDWGSILRTATEYALLYPSSMGCITQLYANTAPEAASKGGTFFIPWAREGSPRDSNPQQVAFDPDNQDLFDKWCSEQIAKHT